MRKWPLLLLLLIVIGGVSANVGIGPAHLKLIFDNKTSTQTITLYAINLDSNPTRIKISADGELAGFVNFSESTLQLGPSETKPFQATINLPENYYKAKYELYIGVTEIPEEGADGTGFAAQSTSSTTVDINKLSGLVAAQLPQNQTNQTQAASNQSNYTGSPLNFVVPIPPSAPAEKKNLFELFTGMFASPLSKLSGMTWQQWIIMGLFIIALILLFSYLKEPNKPHTQLFAYQPRYQYPSSQYPQQPGYGYRR